MLVSGTIILSLSIFAFWYAMRLNLHMFQLNEYKTKEHFKWLAANIGRQWLLLTGACLSLFRFYFASWIFDIILIIWLILIIAVFHAMKMLNVKKKLVFTARIKRLIFTSILLALIFLCRVYFLKGINYLSAALMLIVCIQFFAVIIVNLINKPIEILISSYYINDAKRILKKNKDLVVIGVTGSYGKTSVKYFLKSMLQAKFDVLATPGNFNTPLGVTRTIRTMLKSNHQIFICEMGAYCKGEINDVCKIAKPKHGIITAIGPQHLETFGSIENIVKTKFELADALPEDGMLFLNGDNELIVKNADSYKNKVFYHADFSTDGYFAKDIQLSSNGTSFCIVSPDGESQNYQTKLIGKHNVLNIVGAVAVANKLDISLKDLIVPIRRLEPVEHRLQMNRFGNTTIIDDAYNSNPEGSKYALETLSMFDGLKVLISPGMVGLGPKEHEYNYKFGQYAAQTCDYILLVGKKIAKSIEQGVVDSKFPKDKCIVFSGLKEAMDYANSIKFDGQKFILLENDLPDNY